MTPDLDKAHERAEETGVQEFRIFGPPGTGKTTTLARNIRNAVKKYGDSVLIASFSRAAATELAGKDLPVSRERIGTLHSHCYRALGAPLIAEANVEAWNDENPHLTITPARASRIDGDDGEEENAGKDGDKYLEQLSRFRGMLVPRELWSADVREFERKWDDYKRSISALDFTDLIETALNTVFQAPGAPDVIFIDEAQDLNRLQAALVRKWGGYARFFVLAGDDDQLIYQFAGATPDVLLRPELPRDHIITLKQSYRIPRAVHSLAQSWIEQVSERQPKEYLPRDFEGRVEAIDTGNYSSPRQIIDHAMKHIDAGERVMFLASCSFHLNALVKTLRDEAIPFWNPYRRSNGLWNPIRLSSGSAPNRLLSLLSAHASREDERRNWTLNDIALFAEWLTSRGVLKHGAKKALEKFHESETEAGLDDIVTLFEERALETLFEALDGDAATLIDWWVSRLSDTYAKRADFSARAIKRYGVHAVIDRPLVTVGTIHSVKGGESDVVYLFPDLSRAGWSDLERSRVTHDGVIRQFYVAMTRAREVLYVCDAASEMSVRIQV